MSSAAQLPKFSDINFNELDSNPIFFSYKHYNWTPVRTWASLIGRCNSKKNEYETQLKRKPRSGHGHGLVATVQGYREGEDMKAVAKGLFQEYNNSIEKLHEAAKEINDTPILDLMKMQMKGGKLDEKSLKMKEGDCKYAIDNIPTALDLRGEWQIPPDLTEAGQKLLRATKLNSITKGVFRDLPEGVSQHPDAQLQAVAIIKQGSTPLFVAHQEKLQKEVDDLKEEGEGGYESEYEIEALKGEIAIIDEILQDPWVDWDLREIGIERRVEKRKAEAELGARAAAYHQPRHLQQPAAGGVGTSAGVARQRMGPGAVDRGGLWSAATGIAGTATDAVGVVADTIKTAADLAGSLGGGKKSKKRKSKHKSKRKKSKKRKTRHRRR